MAITQVRKSIYIPGEPERAIERDVIQLRPEELRMLSWLHKWAHEQGINIYCKRCEQPIVGQNNASASSYSVACPCREWRYTR